MIDTHNPTLDLSVFAWRRGSGYYGCHTHSRPMSWWQFSRRFTMPVRFQKIRYRAYLLSWWLHHGSEPTAEDIRSPRAEEIMEPVRTVHAIEVAHSQAKAPKKGKGGVRRVK